MSYPNTTHYSEHFSRKELDCHCGCKTPPTVEKELITLAKHLELLRKEVGTPITVNCAYRCPKQNVAVGGVKDSQHLRGKAADLHQGRLTNAQFASKAAKVPAFNKGGIGMYPSQRFVHVDFRGYVARWDETHP